MIYPSLVQYVPHKFLAAICVLSSVRKIVSFLENLYLRYAACVSYITKLILIFLASIYIKIHCEITWGAQPYSSWQQKCPLDVFPRTRPHTHRNIHLWQL